MANLTLDLGGVVNDAIDAKFKDFDLEGQIKELLGEVAKSASKVIEVKVEGKAEGKRFPLVHMQFEQLLKVVAVQGMNVLLTGGAGLSKSTAVEQVAEALQLELGAISFSNQTTKTDLLGFMDANGIYRKSAFVDAFEKGKIFLADEMDACSSNVLVLLNSAISNGFIETPESKIIRAHENFRFVATANTNLRGAKDGFTARNKLDAATIDRFAVIEWKLDEELEAKITNNDAWLKIVRKARTNAVEKLEGITVTPRSAYDGAKLLRAGLDIEQVIQMTLIRAVGEDEAKVMLQGITENRKREAIRKAGVKPPKVEETPKVEEELPLDEIEVEEVESFEEAKAESNDDDDFSW